MKIIFSDNHVLIISKPSGLATQPSEHHTDSLEDRAKQWLKENFDKKGNVFLHALHRLDTPVSGAVLFARTDKALSRLNQSMRDKQHKKIYLAVVEGKPAAKEAVLRHHHSHHRFTAKVTDKPHEGSKEAVLRYRLLDYKNGLSLLEVELETGRYHQIRAQLSAVGLPIAGDGKYGSKKTLENGAIALHHHRLTFIHPISKEPMEVTDTPPKYYPWTEFSY
ncbi:MAG: RluA family pseudouridine synthase [Deferribacterales bacterium]